MATRHRSPLVTVVVPTWRRPASLGRALAALAAQVGVQGQWEVMVVESGAGDGRHGQDGHLHHGGPRGGEGALGPAGAAGGARALAERGVAVRLLAEQRSGAARARNRGLEEAGGEIVVFLDDDVVPEAGWLSRLVAPILTGEADGTGGRVLLDPTVALPAWFNPDWMAGYLAQVDPACGEHQLQVGEWLVSATAAFGADLVRAAGGFDVALGPRAGTPLVNDDVELSRRLVAGGARLRYVPGATVVHELPASRLTRRYLMRRLWAQGRSDWIMDRGRLAGERWAGIDRAWTRLADDLRLRRGEGIGHPPVALRAVGELCLFAGMATQGARHLARGSTGLRPGGGRRYRQAG